MTLIDPRAGIVEVFDVLAAETGIPLDGAGVRHPAGSAAAAMNWPGTTSTTRPSSTWSAGTASSPRRSSIPRTVALPGAVDAVRAVTDRGGRAVVVTGQVRRRTRPPTSPRWASRSLPWSARCGAPERPPALRELGAEVYVGDHIGDITAARAAEAMAVAVATGPNSAEDLMASAGGRGAGRPHPVPCLAGLVPGRHGALTCRFPGGQVAVADQAEQVPFGVPDEGLRFDLPMPAEHAVGVGEDVVRFGHDLHPRMLEVGDLLVEPVHPEIEQGRRRRLLQQQPSSAEVDEHQWPEPGDQSAVPGCRCRRWWRGPDRPRAAPPGPLRDRRRRSPRGPARSRGTQGTALAGPPRLPEEPDQREPEADRGQHSGEVQPKRQVVGAPGEHAEDDDDGDQAERKAPDADADEQGRRSDPRRLWHGNQDRARVRPALRPCCGPGHSRHAGKLADRCSSQGKFGTRAVSAPDQDR